MTKHENIEIEINTNFYSVIISELLTSDPQTDRVTKSRACAVQICLVEKLSNIPYWLFRNQCGHNGALFPLCTLGIQFPCTHSEFLRFYILQNEIIKVSNNLSLYHFPHCVHLPWRRLSRRGAAWGGWGWRWCLSGSARTARGQSGPLAVE